MKNFNDFSLKVAIIVFVSLCSFLAWSQEDSLNTSSREDYQTTVKEPNEFVRPELRPLNKNVVTSTEQAFADKSKFGIFLFTMGGLNDKNLRGDASSIDFWDNYISLNYKFSDDFALAFRPAFVFNSGGKNSYGDDVEADFQWRDFSMVTAFGEVLEDYLPASVSYKTQIRTYLPTSEYSKATGMIARVRWQNDLKYYFMRYHNARLFFKASYYFQRTTSYLDDTIPNKAPSLRTTPAWDIDWGADITWSLNKKFSLKAGFEAEEDWSNTSSENNLKMYRKSAVRVDFFAVEFKGLRALNLTVSGNLSRDLLRPDKTTEYGITLITSAVLY